MASSIINSDDGSVSGITGLKTTGGDDGALEIQSVGTKYMTVAAGGDISFYEATGTTAKFFWDASAETAYLGDASGTYLSLNGGGNPTLQFTCGTGNNNVINLGDTADSDAGQLIYVHADDSLRIRVNAAERMRIDSSGNVLVGRTSLIGGATGIVHFTNAGNTYAQKCIDESGNTGFIQFLNSSATQVGSITRSGSSTAYNTSSDYRLKEDWQPMSGSIDRLKNLNPVNFAWKADGSRVDGFLAHEAAEVVPEAVSGERMPCVLRSTKSLLPY